MSCPANTVLASAAANGYLAPDPGAMQAIIAQLTCDLKAVVATVRPYKVFVARIQEGSPPIFPYILENTLGFVPTLTNPSAGVFVIQQTGGFPWNKTWISVTHGFIDSTFGETLNAYVSTNNNQIDLQVHTPQISQDWTWEGINGQLEDLHIEIRVYP